MEEVEKRDGFVRLEKLTIITEGGLSMVRYLVKNRVIPQAVVLDATKFKEIIPYADNGDDILFIINGLTDFTMSDIYTVIGLLKQNLDKLGRVTILSNINLGRVNIDYYLYSGDLFYGTVKKVSNGRVVVDEEFGLDIENEGSNMKLLGVLKKKKMRDKNKNKPDNYNKNAVAHAYKVYNSNSVNVLVYSKDKEGIEKSLATENDVLKRVKNINLYAE